MRWVAFVVTFFVGIILCFWSYAWNHREEFVQTALGRLYPSYAITVGSIALDKDGTATIQDITFYPKKQSDRQPQTIAKIVVKASYASWLQWVLMPARSPLHLTSLSVQGCTTALPADVTHPAELFVQIDVLTIEETEA